MKNYFFALMFSALVTSAFSQSFTENVSIVTDNNPKLILHQNSASTPFELFDDNSTRAAIAKFNTSGNALIDIDPRPLDGTSDALFRFFRSTNTTGRVAFEVLRGNNTSQPNARISGNENSYLNAVVGNVGIGTTNPQSKLSVKGKVESEEVQVKQNVADYVFRDDYKLMDLDELESYIKTYGYLPNIQNDESVELNRGYVKLGELSISLMEKIEELTLHVIELNKRIKTLEEAGK